MILKPREDRNASIAALERLMAHKKASRHDIVRLRGQIDSIIKGDLSEGVAAYKIDINFGPGRDWMVIHDLRIVIDGQSAQIDHLIIGKLLDIWVLESKRLASGLKILDNGECITFSNGRPLGIASPIEQNRDHMLMLERLLASGEVTLPRRMGMTLKPKLRSLVLIEKGHITRPRQPVPGIESLTKTDQLVSHILQADSRGSVFDLAKLISPDTLEAFGRQLVAQHRPIEYDWERRFGLAMPAGMAEPPARPYQPPPANVVPMRPAASAPPPKAETAAAAPRPPAGQCDACRAPISSGIKRYCQTNAERFSGRILCMACQPTAATARA